MNIDLCSGRGFWGEDTIRIDIDPSVKPDIIADVRYLPLRSGIRPDKVFATPPCTYLSKARQWRYGFNPLGMAEAFDIFSACLREFVRLEGKTFVWEWGTNLEKMLGHRISFTYDKADIRNATTTFYSNNKGLKRAKIPKEVRQAILEAVEA